jgi:hypothetical protein
MIHASTVIRTSQMRLIARGRSAAEQAKRAALLERPLTFCTSRVDGGQLHPT